MSFSLTTEAYRQHRKFVTRRLGWANLKAGETFMGIEKGQGIPKGGHVVRLGAVVCKSNTPEPLSAILTNPYGDREVADEGFPGMTPMWFVEMFCKANACKPDQIVQRIRFEYL